MEKIQIAKFQHGSDVRILNKITASDRIILQEDISGPHCQTIYDQAEVRLQISIDLVLVDTLNEVCSQAGKMPYASVEEFLQVESNCLADIMDLCDKYSIAYSWYNTADSKILSFTN